jgi:hypothetical protein
MGKRLVADCAGGKYLNPPIGRTDAISQTNSHYSGQRSLEANGSWATVPPILTIPLPRKPQVTRELRRFDFCPNAVTESLRGAG